MEIPDPLLTAQEGKLLFSLLDAAEEDGLLTPFALFERWRALKLASLKFLPLDRAALYRFAEEVAQAGLLDNTWMRDRWLHVKERVERHPAISTPSTAPFLAEFN